MIRGLDMAAKVVLLIMLGLALIHPDLGHMEDKASGLRALTYPMLAFALPATWWLCRRDGASFPWMSDLMVTTTLFTDILGNRMNLFDTLEWFDDWVHVMNPGLLTAAVILLTVPPTSTLTATLERALAFAMTAAVAWEVAEYAAFISRSTEKQSAYADTLADLTLGAAGAVVAALIIYSWRAGGWSPRRDDAGCPPNVTSEPAMARSAASSLRPRPHRPGGLDSDSTCRRAFRFWPGSDRVRDLSEL
ncbi:MAG TPA: hypothetical protein VFI99_14495 [Nocardioides sp.]|nr:hypothetical protein [Nocardioides sp.]